MQDLKIAYIQTELYWQNPQANRAMFEEKIWELSSPVDLIILPEMFTTGFSMEAASFAEVMGTTSVKWMAQMAAQTKAVITGSLIIKDKSNYYNRLIWMYPEGNYRYYDKRHLFRYAGEDKHYQPGSEKLIVDLKGWKICPLICYDLRFPAWSRNLFDNGNAAYDLLIYTANWPERRIKAWDSLLQARAIENLSYVAGINRVGNDENGISYCGHSAAFDFQGETLHASQEQDEVAVVELSYDELTKFRERFPFYLDADHFNII